MKDEAGGKGGDGQKGGRDEGGKEGKRVDG